MPKRRLLKRESEALASDLRSLASYFGSAQIDLADPAIYPLVRVIVCALREIKKIQK